MLPFAPSLIDRFYDERDLPSLESAIAVIGQNRSLPEQFWLFRRLLAWRGWSASGIWQYYEAIAPADFESIAAALDSFELREIAGRYRSGMAAHQAGHGCDDLDHWIDSHAASIEAAAFSLIARHRQFLYPITPNQPAQNASPAPP